MAQRKKINRTFCTTVNGEQFCVEVKDYVWNLASKIYGKSDKAHLYRKDKYDNEIHYNKYGKTSSKFGWEIDHRKPVAKDGTDHPNNLQPLQWNENRIKGDIYPYPLSKRNEQVKNANA
jgi:hypothetical protein